MCYSDTCGLGVESVPESISCEFIADPVSGCNVTTNCGCSWNPDDGVCESDWSSEMSCPVSGDSEIGTCTYTENSQDTCDDDGLLVRSLDALWVWALGNEVNQIDPLNQHFQCVDIDETLPCPASAQVNF